MRGLANSKRYLVTLSISKFDSQHASVRRPNGIVAKLVENYHDSQSCRASWWLLKSPGACKFKVIKTKSILHRCFSWTLLLLNSYRETICRRFLFAQTIQLIVLKQQASRWKRTFWFTLPYVNSQVTRWKTANEWKELALPGVCNEIFKPGVLYLLLGKLLTEIIGFLFDTNLIHVARNFYDTNTISVARSLLFKPILICRYSAERIGCNRKWEGGMSGWGLR